MTENKRFELMSWHFTDNMGVIYDNLEDKELKLSVYGLVDFLNEISQAEYDLLKLRDDVCKKIDEVMMNE